ncbi:MAG: hypothetical protein COB14_08635 [Alphaproteobacteria bacterium]|nr:MAG: hypothetical protein COB14_08635 [Alphaproteobacteria bacterium]
MKQLCTLYSRLIRLSNKTLSPLLDLGIRLFMAKIFFTSGKLRLNDYLNGQWDNQITAFTDYHPIPGIPADIAAIAGTAGEIVLPILLAFGLFTRFGAAGLLTMTLSIQFLVPAEYEIANPDHYMWMLLLAVPLLKGGGVLSADFALRKFFCKKRA